MATAPDIVESLDGLVARIEQSCQGRRSLVAIMGAPGSGKSTLASTLANQIDGAAVLPMDGFHLDDSILEKRGLLTRKGAPETFDVGGLIALQNRLVGNDEDIIIAPSFDRSLEISRAGAIEIPAETRVILVEGNYLLLDQGRWPELSSTYSLTIMIDVSMDVLRARLMERWRGHGFDESASTAKVEGNDLPNAQLVIDQSVKADIAYRQ